MAPSAFDSLLWFTITNIFVVSFALGFLKLRFKLSTSIFAGAVALVLIFLLDCIRFIYIPGETLAFNLVTVFEAVIVQFCVFVVSKYRDGRAVFTGLIASNLFLPGYVVGLICQEVLSSFLLGAAIGVLVHLVEFFLLCKLVRRDYLSLQERSKTGWWSLCLIPVFFYLLFYHVPRTNIMEGAAASLLAIVTMFVTYVVLMRYVASRAAEGDIAQRKAMLEGFSKNLDVEAAALEDSQHRLAILRHDMRHYLSMIKVMLLKAEYDEIQQVLEDVSHSIDKSSLTMHCEDPMLNSIFQALSLKAADAEVDLQTSVLISSNEKPTDLSFAAVIANLVENAIEAASENEPGNRCVEARIRPIKGQLIVEVTNPFSGEVRFGSDGYPQSGKGDQHGFGLQSVKEFALRSNGAFDCEHDGGVFTARLLLPLRPTLTEPA